MNESTFCAEAGAIFASKRVAVDSRTGAEVKEVTKTLALSRRISVTETIHCSSSWTKALARNMTDKLNEKGVGDDGAMDWLATINLDDKIVVDVASCAPAQGSIVTPRRLRIMHNNFLEKHGCADGFAGCRYKRSGLVGSRDHTQT